MKRWLLAFSLLFAHPGFAAEDGHGGDDAAKVEDQFVKMQELIVPVVQDRRLRGMISVEVNLKLSHPSEHDAIMALRPKLTDRYLIALNQLGQAQIDIRSVLDFTLLQAVLQRQTDLILGADRALVLIIDASSRAM